MKLCFASSATLKSDFYNQTTLHRQKHKWLARQLNKKWFRQFKKLRGQ